MKKLMMVALISSVSFAIVGCEEKGPVEKAGAKVDNVLDPRGPAEKTGDKVDKALGK